MADITDQNLQLDNDYTYSTNYPALTQPPVTNVFTGDVTTVVTTINGSSGPNINFSSAIGFAFTGNAGGGVVMTVSDPALVRSSIGAAASGVNTDITQLNGASQVDVSSHYEVNGVQVVQEQGAAVPDATGGATVDAEARAAINTLLARLRAHGLIDA